MIVEFVGGPVDGLRQDVDWPPPLSAFYATGAFRWLTPDPGSPPHPLSEAAQLDDRPVGVHSYRYAGDGRAVWEGSPS